MGKRRVTEWNEIEWTIRMSANLTPFLPNLPSRGHVCSLFILFITCSPRMEASRKQDPRPIQTPSQGVDSFREVEEKRAKLSPWKAEEEIRREKKRRGLWWKQIEARWSLPGGSPSFVLLLLEWGRVKWSRRLEDLSNNVRSAKNGSPRHKGAITIRLTIDTFSELDRDLFLHFFFFSFFFDPVSIRY